MAARLGEAASQKVGCSGEGKLGYICRVSGLVFGVFVLSTLGKQKVCYAFGDQQKAVPNQKILKHSRSCKVVFQRLYMDNRCNLLLGCYEMLLSGPCMHDYQTRQDRQ